PFGEYWDDSLYRASEMDVKLGRFSHAIEDLERLVKEHETTTLIGTYTRPKMSPGLFRIGVIYATKIHDRAEARDAFRRLYKDFATSPLRNDAIWLEAEMWREDGDADKACSRLATLTKDSPDSKYVPCAIDKCPSIKRPEKSEAPRYCHPYLVRP